MTADSCGPELSSHVLDALDQGVAILDAGARVTYANRSLLATLGLNANDVAGKPVEDVLPGLRGEIEWEHAVKSALERGRSIRLTRQELAPERRFDVGLGPLAGNLALLTVAEVSEAVRLEASLQRQARTKAIANLGDSVAHEIRNPLNSIHMNVQLLREGLDRSVQDGETRERLDKLAATVQREIKRLDRVVRDFVQYSRSAALRLEQSAPNLLLRAALDLLDGQIREKHINVELDLQSARPVRLDRDRLQRAFYNILLNAVQVLPQGGQITCRSLDEENRCLIEISDDGPGLDLVESPRLFDLFYTTKPGGTGLGLPIANRIIEEHGGRVAVSSRPGHGATFAVFLPYDGPPETRDTGPTAVPVSDHGDGA